MWVRVRAWRSSSALARVDLCTRGTMYTLIWIATATQIALSVTRPVRHSSASATLIAGTALIAAAQGVCGTALSSRGFDEYLGRGRTDGRLVAAGAVLMTANLGALLALMAAAGVREFPEPGLALGAAAMPFTAAYCLIARPWVWTAQHALLAAGVGGAVALLDGGAALAISCVVSVVFGSGAMSVGCRVSAWTLAVMWELREARDVQTRLAVAEERLRFGRDMHDVLGRNLAVIALKSELAVQLARRGRLEAADQMVEVQRIARESQQEVRAVVRGYREADLRAELLGAQSVLEAAGIDCRMDTHAAGELPDDVQSALGWVVREATTNVLRHGDARRVTISLAALGGRVALVVENDGAPDPPSAMCGLGAFGLGSAEAAETGAAKDSGGSGASGSLGDGAWPPGSGLYGLRERLAALNGTLGAGRTGKGLFRLTAKIPLPREGR
ncbi:histidine kinase [Streptomyces sp. NPDC051907]|uniref:sensor histidine kinase n=1 Tax=Streptomyces sp. NPDC051907 TaxID=3155284 RepID=UPI0034486936